MIIDMTLTKAVFIYAVVCLSLLFLLVAYRIFAWSRRHSAGAFVFLALFPLISLFPIPPSATEQLDKQKREQIKTAENPDDPLRRKP